MAFDKLNTAQREAVTYLKGPCLVLAGAGSGKTRVITAKIAYMVRDHHIKPHSIAAITFTNKAAKEMAHRAKTLLESIQAPSRGLTISTFHALGMSLLRKEHQHIGLKDNFTIMDSNDSASILQDILGVYERPVIKATQTQISLWKNASISPEQALLNAQEDDIMDIARAYSTYNRQLRAYHAVDFDDLIGLSVQLLNEHPNVCERWQNKLRYILIDEVQDTNATQYAFLKQLVGIRAMFTAVGDDDQSIYGWRGATIENLASLAHDYPALNVIKLEQNYRSTNHILQAANQLIAHNPKLHVKQLWSEHGLGDPIQVIAAQHEEYEADSVVTKLLAHQFQTKSHCRDYAILYRSNHQARLIEQKLRAEKVPYILSGGQSFFERGEIKDVLAYLRLIANDDDDQAFMRAVNTPRRGVGTVLLETLNAYSSLRQCSLMQAVFEHGFAAQVSDRQLEPLKAFAELIQAFQWRGGLKGKDNTKAIVTQDPKGEPAGLLLQELIQHIEYEAYINEHFDGKSAHNRWKNVLDFIAWVSKKAENDDKSLAQIAQTMALLSMMDTDEEDPDAVRLSTLHAAKGLEFKHVYLIGCEEGLLPHHGHENTMNNAVNIDNTDNTDNTDNIDNTDTNFDNNILNIQRIEEERRLMYVGVTRAKNTLTLSYCKQRKKGREWELREPSRFLYELGVLSQDSNSVKVKDTKHQMAVMLASLNQSIQDMNEKYQ